MKNMKGFTLVELLATLVILLLLALIVSPKVLSVLRENRNKGYMEIEQRLEEAASKYVVENYIDTSVSSIEITKDELISSKYIGEVYDLKDDSECDAYVVVENLDTMPTFKAVLTCSNYTTEIESEIE